MAERRSSKLTDMKITIDLGQQSSPSSPSPQPPRRRIGALWKVLGAFLFVGFVQSVCSSASRKDSASTSTRVAKATDAPRARAEAKVPFRHVTHSEIGDRWPFTVDEGTLFCDYPSAVGFRAPDGKNYGLNGFGLSRFGKPDAIWARDEKLVKATYGQDMRKSIGDMIQFGLALCPYANPPS